MKNIFKHFNKIDISEIADKEANKVLTALFTIHKTFCSVCRNAYKEYVVLSQKVTSTFHFSEKKEKTRSDKVYTLYSYTLKAALYALVVGVTFSTVGIAYAQTQTELDIIPDITFFEDGNLISFSEEEVENLYSEVIDPLQATLITFLDPETITVEEVVDEVEDQINVLTTLVVEEEDTPEVEEEDTPVVEEEDTPVVEEEDTPVVEEEDTPEVVTSDLIGLNNALSQIEANIAKAIENNNSNALKGLENSREKVLANIEKAQEKLDDGKEKAQEKLEKANEKAQEEIEKAKEKAQEIIANVKDDADEKDVVKAQLKAERTLEKAQEKAEKELAKAQEEAEKELAKAQEEADKEAEKAQKEAEKAQEEADKEAEKAQKEAEKNKDK
jgi:tetratricopeptide (TPR) repeat protein